ncbi:restriction endonuclease [Streptomyces sp. NPDC018972]|uniref:restriction endonuclease n=1 Tax=Streptomyces sp. NPDC018972 TaxID=3365060 RepID=UPI00379D61D7
MTWQAFERHVADLLRRDGCSDVVVRQTCINRGIDITARTADGRTVAVRCKNRAGHRHVPSSDMQRFAGAARAVERVDIALFVTTSCFSHEAQAIADLGGVLTVDRTELEAWSAGARLKALRWAREKKARSRKGKLRLRAFAMLGDRPPAREVSSAPSAASARCPPSPCGPVRPTRCSGTCWCTPACRWSA